MPVRSANRLDAGRKRRLRSRSSALSSRCQACASGSGQCLPTRAVAANDLARDLTMIGAPAFITAADSVRPGALTDNTGLPFFIGGVGNARWTGTPLHSLLRQADPADGGTEVVFWGADRGAVTIRDNSGITGAGNTGVTEPDAAGGLDLTITEQFARSMSLSEAMAPDNLLCFEMNGEPLPREHLSGPADRARLVRRSQRQVADPDRGHRPALCQPVHGS